VTFTAGRIMLERLHQLADAGEDFAFESTLSSRTFAPFLRDLKARGYGVAIYYFSLANAQLAVRRVKLRVALGGHDVPADVVKRRFGRSLKNFFSLYAPLASRWVMFDNSQSPHARQIAIHERDNLTITEASIWHALKKLANRD
jgi:predicted ABC-type ATPase